ncbi:MAG: bifunctional glutamate N-acetyltransferase/amino-acid acetyltransferase ArgJ [Dehalococcoidia bacterium]|nr:bifunctional glutamate N-acetyltransferase/amino-acid acetyltransferase ArgJ [Dehalococcoidia bacterium]
MDFSLIPDGAVSSVPGFVAGAVHAGIKDKDELDLAILYSEAPCVTTGVFTSNLVKSAPIILSQRHLTQRKARAIVVNSGCANACLGEQGMIDASEMATLAAAKLGLPSQEVLVASTGVIGKPLPMSRIRNGIEKIEFHQDGGHELARAMMTTDTSPKEIAIQVEAKEGKFTIGGVAKGAGMMHPELATMLCFITTDAAVSIDFLQQSLKKVVDVSFNMLSIDGETSPSDCVFLLANSLARNTEISFSNGEAFQSALTEVCVSLAKSTARDGEGATKLIEVIVEGAINQMEARQAARTIVSSPLVKAAMHGGDPNWGRIVAALGRSGAKIREDKLDVHLNDICVMKQGVPIPFDQNELRTSLARANNVPIKVYLNLGDGRATAWGCDLSEEYVTINSEYAT